MYGNNSDKQAYDRGSTIFSPDGRLYQVEYAREAVKRGSASVGIRTPEGIVFAAEIKSRSPLIERDSVEKLHKADSHIGIASAGHVADARHLVDKARQQAQINRLSYGESIDVESLTKHVTDYIQQHTQSGGTRPFGVTLLIGGVENGTPYLYESDPSGTPYEWKAAAIGGNRAEIHDIFEEHYTEDMSLKDATNLVLEGLASVNEDTLTAQEVAVATVETDTEEYRTLDIDEIEETLSELDLLPDSTDEEQEDDSE